MQITLTDGSRPEPLPAAMLPQFIALADKMGIDLAGTTGLTRLTDEQADKLVAAWRKRRPRAQC